MPPEETLRVAVLLSLAGGFLDAFTWIAHGGVFANAQTGNVVLLGVAAATGQWPAALHHIPPIVAFLLGVFVAHRLRRRATRRGAQRAALFSLAVEIALLLAVAALPARFADLPIVLGIAFVAALQSSSFARVEGATYSSVMTTGNLRRTAEALLAGIGPPHDSAALRQGQVFAAICGMFCLGAALGAFATGRFANAAVLVPAFLLAIALVLCLRGGRG
jgi:uncharacterized membrane protein YoaK (UPF0700 family)